MKKKKARLIRKTSVPMPATVDIDAVFSEQMNNLGIAAPANFTVFQIKNGYVVVARIKKKSTNHHNDYDTVVSATFCPDAKTLTEQMVSMGVAAFITV